MTITNWGKELSEKFKETGDSWYDIVSNTMTSDQIHKEFDDGYGGNEGCSFTVWTTNYVYFPVCRDGAEWVGFVPRNPNGKATSHQGGS